MYYNYEEYLSYEEQMALNNAINTSNMLKELAYLRMENEQLKLDKEKHFNDIDKIYKNTQQSLGNALALALNICERDKE